MWIALWSVLAVAAVAVPVLLGLGLWRRVKALGREAAAFSEALAPRWDGPEDERVTATLFDAGTVARAGEVRRANRARRAARRSDSLGAALDRWTRHGLLG